jgi:hypothetical protein
MTREIRFDQNNDGLISDDEAAFYLSGHESYNKVLIQVIEYEERMI